MRVIIPLFLSLLLLLSGCGGKQPAPEQQLPKSNENTSTEVETDQDTDQDQDTEQVSPPDSSKEAPPKQQKKPNQEKPNVEAEVPQAPSPTPKPKEEPVQTPSNPTPPPPTPPPAAEPEVKEETVQLSIRGDQELGVVLEPTEVALSEGDTVINVLSKTLKEKRIPLDYKGVGPTVYVEGIANLYEFDRGPLSGWVFRVNDGFGSQSAGTVKLQPGDRIEWLYTLDLGKDVGATP